MKFAVQLYSLRDYIAEQGLEKALSAVAQAGFEGVETAGFYGKSAEELKPLFEKYNLTPFSAHVGAEELRREIATIKALGIKCAVIPWLGFNGDLAYEEGRRIIAEAAELASQNGLAIAYHNHAHEFLNGTDVVSDLARDIPALKLEPDVFWLAVAGIDAVPYLKKHRDRLIYLHIKELGEGAEGVNLVPGEGNAHLAAVLEYGKEIGLEWSILEAERLDMPVEEYLKRSYAFMKKYQ